MLAEFIKNLYSVGIQVAPPKTFDWMSILSYFKNNLIFAPPITVLLEIFQRAGSGPGKKPYTSSMV